jgi:hypothetical protein
MDILIQDRNTGRPAIAWGLGATLGFSLAVAAAFAAAQVLGTVGTLWLARTLDWPLATQSSEALSVNGLLLAVATLLSAPLCLALTVLFARLRRGVAVRDYLALRLVSAASVARWLLGAAALAAFADFVTWAADRPIVPEFMRWTYESAYWPALYWLAIVVAAPLFEEVFFRGFLFRGLAASWLGTGGAVVVTAVAWALVHTQYDLFELALVVAGGLFLGVARARSGSVLLTALLHAFWNLVAVAEVAIAVA